MSVVHVQQVGFSATRHKESAIRSHSFNSRLCFYEGFGLRLLFDRDTDERYGRENRGWETRKKEKSCFHGYYDSIYDRQLVRRCVKQTWKLLGGCLSGFDTTQLLGRASRDLGLVCFSQPNDRLVLAPRVYLGLSTCPEFTTNTAATGTTGRSLL